MNPFLNLSVEVSLTVLVCVLVTRYLRTSLYRVLVDLCKTEDRAQFWVTFANILLIGLPLIIALGFRPESGTLEEAIFEMLGRLSGNLAGYLFALVGLGFIVTIFALVATRPAEAK
jgi:hypothetical protein